MGKRHCINVSRGVVPSQEAPPTSVGHSDGDDGGASSLQIAPGEPLPPGFEGQVEEIAHIQEKIDNFKSTPLVALEYLLEMQFYDPSKEPLYLCVLCDKKGDPRTVWTHLSSYNHVQQYLQKHFPTCYRKLAPYMTKQYKRGCQRVLLNIAEAIEQKFGRLKPMPIDKDKFDADMAHYLSIVCKSRHFSEKSGYTFEELVNMEELSKVTYEVEAPPDLHSMGPGVSSISKPFKKRSPSPPVVARPTKKNKGPMAGGSQGNGMNRFRDDYQRPDLRKQRRRSLSSVSSISSNDLSDRESDRSSYRRQDDRRKKFPIRSYRSPERNFYRRNELERKDGPMPWQKSNYMRRQDKVRDDADKNRDKAEEYKKLARAIETDMAKTLSHHEKNPEKHPQYNEEWKKFWNKRYKELQAEGKDAANYDFKPEWIQFWNKRMVELHQEDIKSRKDALRKRLGLPEEPTPISFRIAGKGKIDNMKKSPNSNKPVPMAARPDESLEDDVIFVNEDKAKNKYRDDKRRSQSPWEDEVSPVKVREDRMSRDRRSKDSSPRDRRRSSSKRRSRSRSRDRSRDRYQRRSRSRDGPSKSRERSRDREFRYRESSYERDVRGKERIRTVADLPWEREKYYYKPPAVMRDVTRNPVIIPPVSVPEDDDVDEEVNLVSVLRLLTAVEERLGSLGPKVIDLLAQALAMEKIEANSSENLLDNDINCVLFETVKEKLKGQVLAGLVDPIQERAFKKAIKKTASLLHMAGQRQKSQPKSSQKLEPVSVPGVGEVDKAAIAKQIASALIAQGKTDVTQDQLEQLINAVVGMAEASKKAGKPISTANFLGQLAEEEEKSSIKDKDDSTSLDRITEPLTPSPKSSHNMDHLSDSDLQTLLQNFKDLQTEEQHGLISYLKKLEAFEPDRVERLRKFVNLKTSSEPEKTEKPKQVIDIPDTEDIDDFEDDEVLNKSSNSGRESPFSKRLGSVNPTADEKKETAKIQFDSEDEDYNFEDVVKAVSKNVKAKELEKERQLVEESMKKTKNVELVDAKSIISNLMSNFNKNKPVSSNLLGLGTSTSTITTAPSLTSNLDLSSIHNINMANIANIVGNAQKLMQENRKDEFKEDFPPLSTDRLDFDSDQKPASKVKITSNIVLNRIDRSNTNTQQNLGSSRSNFETNRSDSVTSRPMGLNLNLNPQMHNMSSSAQQSINPGMHNSQMNTMQQHTSDINRVGPWSAPRSNVMNRTAPPRGNYPVNNYGGNFGSNYQAQPNVTYPNIQNMPRGGNPYDQWQRFNNPRFQGNQYNPRPGGNYNNRW
ncbi:uncharacterized protein CG7065-like isoform X2 [Aethina tumida]|nr:uncharacterized protein CG7065-like isoform X2 [Aethina tumida]XP_049818173.1 uncharacterized protein CG7065-like isoform X2 [Aethina tumida]